MAVRPLVASSGRARKSIMTRVGATAFQSSTKIEALREELFEMKRIDPSAKAIVFSQFVSMLDAVSAYRPNDADVVFLDIVGRASDEKKDADAATVRLTKPDAWSSDVGFVPVENPGDGDVHAGFYLITRRFMETDPRMIDEGGFGFVDEWLAEKCERSTAGSAAAALSGASALSMAPHAKAKGILVDKGS